MQELDRMAAAFDASWEEQLWRIRVEQEVFSCQRADVMTLRNELKHLSNVASQLEPYIRSLTPAQQTESEKQAEQAQHLQQLLEHIGKVYFVKNFYFLCFIYFKSYKSLRLLDTPQVSIRKAWE